jgi:hypothetical protein
MPETKSEALEIAEVTSNVKQGFRAIEFQVYKLPRGKVTKKSPTKKYH